MPTDVEPTPGTQPEANQPTPATAGPESVDGGEQSTESPSPTMEELRAQAERYRANAAGRQKEAERLQRELEAERQRSAQAQHLLAQYQTQPPAKQQRKPEVNLADEEREYQQALLESNYAKSAEILARRELRIAEKAREEVQSSLGQYSANMARLNALQAFMVKKGFGDPKSEAFKEAQARIQAAFSDPEYSFLGSQEAIAAVVASEISSERRSKLERVQDKVKDEVDNESYTEGASRSNGTPPGKKNESSKIYLNQMEREKMVRWYMKRDNLSQSAAERKYWDGLPASVREARIAARKA